MIVSLSKYEMFKLLQSNSFVIGHDLYRSTKANIEKNSGRSFNYFSENNLAQLSSNFSSLRKKWKQLKGGFQRSLFFEKNMKENLTLRFDESEFIEVDAMNLNETTQIMTQSEISLDESLISKEIIQYGTKDRKSLFDLIKMSSRKRKTARKIRAKIQKHLNDSNNFLGTFGVCFKKIELADSSLHNYSKTFKIIKQAKIFKNSK